METGLYEVEIIRTYFFSNYLILLSKTVELGSLVLNVNVLKLDKGGIGMFLSVILDKTHLSSKVHNDNPALRNGHQIVNQ